MGKLNNYRGYLYAFTAYLLWGLLPIYWHNMSTISSFELVAIRIIFSAFSILIFMIIKKKYEFLMYIKTKKIRNRLIISSILIGINWMVFLIAVKTGYVVQASLGYYINPLFSVGLGIIFFKEKLNKLSILAIVLACVGVLYMTISLGEFPVISFILAFSFGLYGFSKKTLRLDSLSAVMVECVFLSLIAIPYVIITNASGTSTVIQQSGLTNLLIVLSGVVTVIPLALFGESIKHIPLSSVGFLQYFAPTLMLLIGVLLYGESFTRMHGISFAFIWAGCIIYIINIFVSQKANKLGKIKV